MCLMADSSAFDEVNNLTLGLIVNSVLIKLNQWVEYITVTFQCLPVVYPHSWRQVFFEESIEIVELV